MSKLYTRKGDDGTTGLVGGGPRVRKDSLRVQTYGTVDELNSFIGSALVVCEDPAIATMLSDIQARLFDLGADLATPGDSDQPARIGSTQVTHLEAWIDEVCQPLPAMKYFILPGGSEWAARLHLARTVCRRAERLCLTLADETTIDATALVYLNRLSDLLFALARRANQLAQVDDVPWRPQA